MVRETRIAYEKRDGYRLLCWDCGFIFMIWMCLKNEIWNGIWSDDILKDICHLTLNHITESMALRMLTVLFHVSCSMCGLIRGDRFDSFGFSFLFLWYVYAWQSIVLHHRCDKFNELRLKPWLNASFLTDWFEIWFSSFSSSLPFLDTQHFWITNWVTVSFVTVRHSSYIRNVWIYLITHQPIRPFAFEFFHFSVFQLCSSFVWWMVRHHSSCLLVWQVSFGK